MTVKRKLLAAALFLFLAACSDPAAELYETAQLEETQRNKSHAIKLYRQIVDKYPDSAEAELARQRLAEIESP